MIDRLIVDWLSDWLTDTLIDRWICYSAVKLSDRTNLNGANGNGKSSAAQTPSSTQKSLEEEVPMDTSSSFSEAEEEIPFTAAVVAPVKRRPHTISSSHRPSPRNPKPSAEPSLSQCIDLLPSTLQPLLVQMRDGSDEEKCSAMELFVGEVINDVSRESQKNRAEKSSIISWTSQFTLLTFFLTFSIWFYEWLVAIVESVCVTGPERGRGGLRTAGSHTGLDHQANIWPISPAEPTDRWVSFFLRNLFSGVSFSFSVRVFCQDLLFMAAHFFQNIRRFRPVSTLHPIQVT